MVDGFRNRLYFYYDYAWCGLRVRRKENKRRKFTMLFLRVCVGDYDGGVRMVVIDSRFRAGNTKLWQSVDCVDSSLLCAWRRVLISHRKTTKTAR